ncbi:unnamed protein product [Rotaria sp. Silwood2]|nr:unnamed protein product [Rotaria sp. Silwood2]CAF2864996.1 unnamed protein product [Rotaria sp. Silwood2]CAF3305324.1 unnamed protein product [Rotaria sp. Silwood2]CAF4251266.1 unnamed protein product [Rotaria sp. Silwood2]CAF4475880.1 unnamed protein product [Rotaria sp. Silwood2]
MKNEIIGQWRLEAAKRAYLLANLSDPETIDGKVSCRSCDYYLGELSWIRKRNNNYFVQQQQFIERIEIERYPTEQIIKEIQLNGKIRCGNKQCREELGGLQLFRDRPDVKEMCALKCKQLKFSYRNKDGEPQVFIFKKWTDVKFKVLDLEPINIDYTLNNQQ